MAYSVPKPRGPRTRTKIGGAVLAAVVVAVVALAVVGAYKAGPATAGHVKLVTSATAAPQTLNPETEPFGAPSLQPDYAVPPPPGQPTLVPTIGTKSTQRLYGENPFQEAVSVTQHVWPAVLAENLPTENNNVPDRPWGVTLVTPDDPLTALTAGPLPHFPVDAPILFGTQ